MKHILFVFHLATEIVELLEGKVSFMDAVNIAIQLIKDEFNLGNKTDNSQAWKDLQNNPKALIDMAEKHLKPEEKQFIAE